MSSEILMQLQNKLIKQIFTWFVYAAAMAPDKSVGKKTKIRTIKRQRRIPP